MSTGLKVNDSAIRSRVGERSYTLGERYYRNGAIFNARRQGQTLKASCQGSRDEPYQVEVTFGDEGVTEAECSCPVGDGGHCKHVAALLLTWKHQPEDFIEVEDLNIALERRSKAELIALIKKMLRRDPDLELLLVTPAEAGAAPDTEQYYRQARNAFRGVGYEWGAAAAVAGDLQTLVEEGDTLLQEGNFAEPAAVYLGVTKAIREGYHGIQDEEGDLHGVVNDCVTGLGKCLTELKDDPVRRAGILRELWDICCFDIEAGGIGMGDETGDFLIDHTTPEEKQTIAGWVRAAMPTGQDWGENWRRQTLGSFLLDLEGETLDDEAFLRVCRETDRRSDLVERLLQLGRVEEAVTEAKKASDYELLTLADCFVAHEHGDIADRLMLERSKKKERDERIVEWLRKRALDRGDQATALRLSEQMFRQYPSLEDYQAIRQLAQEVEQWDKLRPKLLTLLKQPDNHDVLIQVHLDEGEIDEAIQAVKKERGGYGFGFDMALEVAKAAEKTRPQGALDIYRKQAEQEIAHRSRTHYQTACQYLKKVRELYHQLGQEDAWTEYLAQLREQNRTLRALQEEIQKARLV